MSNEHEGRQYGIAATGAVFENEDGTRRQIVAFIRTELHEGSNGLWNPREGDEQDVLIAFEDPDKNDDEFEASIVLSAADATGFAFAVLEASGIEVTETETDTGEKYIYHITRTATASLYQVRIPEEESA